MNTLFKLIPQVQKLLEHPDADALQVEYGHARLVEAIRAQLDALRAQIANGAISELTFDVDRFLSSVGLRLKEASRMNLQPVINATGIVIHTNLGRAPLSRSAIAAVGQVAGGYSNLELDLETGKRGSRYSHIEDTLRALTGAEAAVVVNNNAAAVMLALNTFAMDAEVVISRGELIEIGGSFRIPDVITRSGGRLVEVGATNKNRIEDYEAALTDQTAALLKVHPSNFQIMGFTGSASRAELVALASERNLMVIEDLGSGTLVDLSHCCQRTTTDERW